MPAIRDFSYDYETNTGDAGVTINTPQNSTNDLLLAVIVADTFSGGTWNAPSGWTKYIEQTNTVSCAIFYKISGGSEAASFTFGSDSGVNETYQGGIFAIRDINTSAPFGGTTGYVKSSQTSSAADWTMDSITTDINNSLVFYVCAGNGGNFGAFANTKSQTIVSEIGSGSEALTIGWDFRPTAGATPSTTCEFEVANTGVKLTIKIAPPSGGATVIPTYTVSDTSVFLSNMNGAAARNKLGAWALTSDTNFGTTLGGATNSDATIGSSQNNGLNPSRFSLFVATPASPTIGNVYGAESAFTSSQNLSGKNICVHYNPPTGGFLRCIPNIVKERGIWIGLRSSTSGDYKIFNCQGWGSPETRKAGQPFIFNEGATSLIATAGTLNASAVTAIGVFVSNAITTSSNNAYLSNLLALGVLTVAGGNSTSPITLSDISDVVVQRERNTAIMQSNSQMFLYQEITFGDGGTSPVYLNLDACAIAFPGQYSVTNKRLTYNSTDNKVGIYYYPGSSGVIKHTNSVISSPSRYYWGLHASASASATYDFSGLVVVGAGTITLNKAISIAGLTISDYSTLDVSGLTLTGSAIKKPPSSNDSLSTSGSTSISGCSINVSTVSSGNRWCSVANPTIFSGCDFVGGGGHAIRITSPGTYSFSGNTFTGFGADASGGAAIYNDSGGLVTLNITGGGSTPTYKNGTGASTTINNAVSLDINNIVNGSTLYLYDTVTMTELHNGVVGTSHSEPLSTTGNLITIKLRKAGYKTWESSSTPGATGASVTADQEQDLAYNASYNAGMATDWSINTSTKKLTRNTSNWNTVRDFHSYWNSLFAGTSYMEFDVPTSAFTKYDVQFENGYTFNAADDFQKLKTGSITDPGADDLWGSVITLGNASTETVYIAQSGVKLSSYWSAGNVDILVKVKAGGSLINSGLLDVYCRDFNSVYDHTQLTITEGGKNYASLNVGADGNNETPAGTVSGYSDIVLDETGVTVDITAVAIDGDDTPANYTLGVDAAGRSVQEVYEYLKHKTRGGEQTQEFNSVDGEQFYHYSTYAEVKNGPLGAFVGGVFYGARGVWLTNVATSDALNYVLTSNDGATHQAAAPPVAISVTNIVSGSRIQVYDLTGDVELANEVVSGTTWSLEKAYTGDLDIRVRLAYVSGASIAYEWYESQGTFSSTGMSLRASQATNSVYITNNIDGSVVTECSISGTNIRIYVDDPDNTTSAQRIYNWYQYILTTESGIRDQDGSYISATDTTHYTFDDNMKIVNQDTVNPLNIVGANIVPQTGPATNIFDLANGASIALNFNRVEGFAYSSGSGLSTEEHNWLDSANAAATLASSKAAASLTILETGVIDADVKAVNGVTLGGVGTSENPWGPA